MFLDIFQRNLVITVHYYPLCTMFLFIYISKEVNHYYSLLSPLHNVLYTISKEIEHYYLLVPPMHNVLNHISKEVSHYCTLLPTLHNVLNNISKEVRHFNTSSILWYHYSNFEGSWKPSIIFFFILFIYFYLFLLFIIIINFLFYLFIIIFLWANKTHLYPERNIIVVSF